MTRHYVNPTPLKRQTYYNHAVVKTGVPVFLTGQVAWDAQGELVGRNDIAAQMTQIWSNILTAVADIGGTPGDIVKLVTYATSREWLPAIHAERARHFSPGCYPASTFVLVQGLVDPEMMVEIDVTVVLPESR